MLSYKRDYTVTNPKLIITRENTSQFILTHFFRIETFILRPLRVCMVAPV
jgi:hypothetical protein